MHIAAVCSVWGRLKPQFTEKVLGSCNAIGKACCKYAVLVVPCSTSGARNQTKGGEMFFCFVLFFTVKIT